MLSMFLQNDNSNVAIDFQMAYQRILNHIQIEYFNTKEKVFGQFVFPTFFQFFSPRLLYVCVFNFTAKLSTSPL